MVTGATQPGSDVLAAQPRALIVTIYGLYAREPRAGWLSIAALIRLMAELGVDEPAVRSAISRLKLRGLLERGARNGRGRLRPLRPRSRDPGRGRPPDFPSGREPARPTAGCWRCSAFPSTACPAACAAVPAGLARLRHGLGRSLDRAARSWPARRATCWRADGLTAYVSLFTAGYLAFGDVGDKVGRVVGPGPAGAALPGLHRRGRAGRWRAGQHRQRRCRARRSPTTSGC